MNRLTPHTFRRAAVVGLSAAVVCAATTGGYIAPQTVVAGRALTIPVVLTGAIDEAPTTLGIADSNLYTLSPADIDATLDRLKGLGVNDIRIAVPWIYTQPTNGEDYDWTKLDYVVHAASEREMNIVGAISGTPAWAGFPINGHSDPADYARFAAAVADRYKDDTIGEIDAYEVWNEPNGSLFYNPIDAAAYTAMLRAAYPAIKANNPNAVVIAGVLGSVSTIPGLSLQPQTFVAQMYDAGAQGSFDAMSFHPYHYTLPFSLGADVTNSPLSQVEAIRALMNAHGDEALKIWATEYGLPTNPQLSETQQAAFIHDFVASWQGVKGAGPIFVYTTRDANTGGFDDEENFGIFHTDWTPKPAAQTIEDLIDDLADGTAEPFDVTPFVPAPNFLNQLLIVGRQVISLLLIVPRALLQLATSAVTFVVQAVGSLLGVTQPVAGAAPGLKAAPLAAAVEPVATAAAEEPAVTAPRVLTKRSAARVESDPATTVSEKPKPGLRGIPARTSASAPKSATAAEPGAKVERVKHRSAETGTAKKPGLHRSGK